MKSTSLTSPASGSVSVSVSNSSVFFRMSYKWSQAACSLLNLASLVAQKVKNLPPMQETQVRSLGQEDPLEKGLASRSSILAWRIPWTEELGWLQSNCSL